MRSSGLKISQSYMLTDATTVNLNFQITTDKYDKDKEHRGLMSDPIYTLLLSYYLIGFYLNCLMHSFILFITVLLATRIDKAFLSKIFLAFVYTDLYTNNQYLVKFDQDVSDTISKTTQCTLIL